MANEGKPSKTPNPDAELTRQFGIGCLVLLGAFFVLWAFVWFFYMRG